MIFNFFCLFSRLWALIRHSLNNFNTVFSILFWHASLNIMLLLYLNRFIKFISHADDISIFKHKRYQLNNIRQWKPVYNTLRPLFSYEFSWHCMLSEGTQSPPRFIFLLERENRKRLDNEFPQVRIEHTLREPALKVACIKASDLSYIIFQINIFTK